MSDDDIYSIASHLEDNGILLIPKGTEVEYYDNDNLQYINRITEKDCYFTNKDAIESRILFRQDEIAVYIKSINTANALVHDPYWTVSYDDIELI